MRAYLWYYHRPGMAYAESFRFRRPFTEREARAFIRERFGYNRLPAGSCVWRA